MGITKGKWSTLVTELINFKDLYDANAPLKRVLPALVEAHPEAYGDDGPQGPLRAVHQVYREDNLPKAQKDMYTTLPEMAMRPADAYERLVRGQVESVEIDQLMGRTLAVMVVPYPPGIPVIMPGERITPPPNRSRTTCCTRASSTSKFPGFETDIHGLRFEPDCRRQALSGRLRRARERPMIPRAVKAPTIPIPFHKLLKVVAIVDATNPQTQAAARSHRRRELRSRSDRQLRPRRLRGRRRSAPTSR